MDAEAMVRIGLMALKSVSVFCLMSMMWSTGMTATMRWMVMCEPK